MLKSVAVVAWLALLGAGWTALNSYSAKAGHQPRTGPNPIDRNNLPSLRIFLHPRCPCSKASVQELAEVAARFPGRVRIQAYLTCPAGADEQWTDSAVARAVREIPGAIVMLDEDGREASRRGAATSGQVQAHATDGRLVFSGGITRARGHQGESAGRRSLVAWLSGGDPETSTTPVYGCDLVLPEDGETP